MNDNLVQIKRISETKVEMKNLLPVTFATLMPSWVGNDPTKKSISLRKHSLYTIQYSTVFMTFIKCDESLFQIFNG